MPINKKKTYTYKPSKYNSNPFIPTYNAYRARSGAADTFFRAKDTGDYGNKISIQIETEGALARLIVKAPIRVTRPVFSGVSDSIIVNILVTKNSTPQDITVTCISQNMYSVDSSVTGNLGQVQANKIFRNSEVSFVIIPDSNIGTDIGDTFTFTVEKPYEVYESNNNQNPNTDPNATTTIPSPAYEELRNQVNANSTLIEMNSRGSDFVDAEGTDMMTGRSVRAAGTEPLDGALIPTLEKTFLSGGEGLAFSPVGINTGPERTFIHINFSELDDGTVTEVNKIYEWVGSSSVNGKWGIYY